MTKMCRTILTKEPQTVSIVRPRHMNPKRMVLAMG
jgi:hypothetical protein